MKQTSIVDKFITTSAGVKMPQLIYGTAWKKEKTSEFVKLALESGFMGFDTACQPKHYYEPGTGAAIKEYLEKNPNTKRSDYFIQTKFTFYGGQDPNNIPYNPKSKFEEQVLDSFAVSLKNLNTDYIDSYVLHGPWANKGITQEDWEVWNTMTSLYKSGKVKQLGISNIGFNQLKLLVKSAEVKPAVVQNRCFARTKWDRETRKVCNEYNIIYQGFSLLTANPYVLTDEIVLNLSKEKAKTPEQIIFKFATQIGIAPLTGTTNKEHMTEDLNIYDFELSNDEVSAIENIADRYRFN